MNAELLKKWEEIKVDQPKLRIRDASVILGVSEAELLASKIGKGVWILKNDFPGFLTNTSKLGYVMALTRNEACVHERKGEYKNISINGQTALVVGDDIDLRVFLRDWKYGFYVEDNSMSSFQFFGSNGEAIHKIFKTDKSSLNGWESVKQEFIAEEVHFEKPASKPVIETKKETNDSNQIPSFLEEWSKLKDTHDFFSLIQKFKFSRNFAVTSAVGKFSFPISKDEFFEILKLVSDQDEEIMIFVGNPGMIQIHTGFVKKLEMMGPWFNVLDPEFNLHLRSDLIETIWIVDKPTVDGLVTSIEVYDKDGMLIVQCFGKRKPGYPQKEIWYNLTRKYVKL